ncbi:MAG TPA: prepilin-type N-terminal cleavage/methylation domain-containing protein [Polyangiaceae bacterium]|nr:prepilin-type N-terminal cleavage/methylation domain-containing protein [Polyangiaceae bacterium]
MSGRAAHIRGLRGFTLVELLVAIVVLSLISVLIYNAFASMKRSREGIERVDDRYREGRLAMTRMVRELQSAYISLHAPINSSLLIQKTAFIGTTGTPADRLDFNSFSNRRMDKNSHVSDQCELSYFGSSNPDVSGVTDLARRISTTLDLEPKKGGRVEVLATDIDLFDLQYLDPLTGNWVDTWDTTSSVTGQPARLPVQVRIVLVLNGGSRQGYDRGQGTVRLMTKVSIPIDNALNFAVMQ